MKLISRKIIKLINIVIKSYHVAIRFGLRITKTKASIKYIIKLAITYM